MDTNTKEKEVNASPILNNSLPFGVDTEIKNCESSSLFEFFLVHFSNVFGNIQELRDFISFLFENKQDIKIDYLLKNFVSIVKEFKEK